MPESKKLITLAEEGVINKIHYIRKEKVMLDKDLAELYGIRAIRLREQVKRNIERFPSNFMFQLTPKEVESMVSQIAIPSRQQLGGHLPYAFTEHGVLMLGCILKSEKAIQVSIRVIEIFVKMREMLSSHNDILAKLQKVDRKLASHDEEIQLIFEYLKKLFNPTKETRPRLGFKRNNEKD